MKSQRGIGFFAFIFWVAVFVGLAIFGWYLTKLDTIVRTKFEGKRWDIPAKIYARPLELKRENKLPKEDLLKELELLGYRKGDYTKVSGTYTDRGNDIFIHTRGFNLGGRNEPKQIISVSFQNNIITSVKSNTKNNMGNIFLEPLIIGAIYPQHNEDRELIKLENTPKDLINALIATEDRNFYKHHGVSIRGTARALLTNLTGGKQQGGSTLTQQLIKNFYLSSEKTYKRKANEALMAMLLELHYSKDEILETYLNEVHLGQNGNVSINGYGLASEYYFGRKLNELNDISKYAFLAGLVQGPSLYNPWKNPEGAKKRRNVVLKNMVVMGYLTQAQYEKESKKPLGILRMPKNKSFPDFMDIVRRELQANYLIENLENQGLSIITTLDPIAQARVQKIFKTSISNLTKSKGLPPLQGATIVSDPTTGYIQVAVASSEEFIEGNFNRVLDAKRQVGSLLKPVIYLNALETERYHWGSQISDTSITIPMSINQNWTPKNYGGREYGQVPMVTALANSYNLSAVRIAHEGSINNFMDKLYRLGIPKERKIPNYPSIYLGAVEFTPMDILTMYQTFATGGKKRPLQSIQRVVGQDGQILERFVPSTQQVIKPEYAYLINYGLQQVMTSGTARNVYNSFSPTLKLAGKTGTTNDGRDSWFAGYSGNHVAVVWLGLDKSDKNKTSLNLTGGTGALPVWINVMKQFDQTPVQLPETGNIEWHWIDRSTGKLSAEGCENSLHIPMIRRTVPRDLTECATRPTTQNYPSHEENSLDVIDDSHKIRVQPEQQPMYSVEPQNDETSSSFGTMNEEQTSFNEQNTSFYRE